MSIGSSVNCYISEGQRDEIIEYLKKRNWKLATVMVTGEHPNVKPNMKDAGDRMGTFNTPAIEYELDNPFTISISFI